MLKPWYKVVSPREDLRTGKPLDASEFAVHLDQVRDGHARMDYQDPERFFERTYLTKNLISFSAEVLRRLSGITTETSAVFGLTTQFGGGKTHFLTLLYHLAKAGAAADRWFGVSRILERADLPSVQEAAVAVFVGTEFDSIVGRGGDDGTPLRKTPWGEIAYQLGGEAALAVLKEHEERFIEPKGDVIRKFLPKDRPVLILMDEIINYVSTYRSLGYHNKLYNFIQSLSETARGQQNVVLVVSLPKSDISYTAEDTADQQRFEHMLNRLGKAVVMSADTETSEIIRRRLFEWDLRALTVDGRVPLTQEAKETCRAHADWVLDHRSQLPGDFPFERAQEAFEATYPFHPSVFSVFERKWQALPRFQRTRGVLRLLALWVSRAYQDGYKGAQRDPLISLGSAPFDDSIFRAAVFEELGEQKLEAAVTTDICGKKDSHAIRLDEEAVETIREARLHRKIATGIFFESNGGQMRGVATVPEIRFAVSDPSLDIGNVETVLESLRGPNGCYYLVTEGNAYRFGISPNLNKLWSDRRATVQANLIEDAVRDEIEKVFKTGSGIERVFFPEESIQIADRPALRMLILAPEHHMKREDTLPWIDKMTREVGSSNRTFKSALIWIVPDSDRALSENARQLLAWKMIDDEYRQGLLSLDDLQKRQLSDSIAKSKRDLHESVWRQYHSLVLLDSDNDLRVTSFPYLHSSAAENLVGLILTQLRQSDEIVEGISPNFLLRNWVSTPEWSTKAIRDAFFASPKFPRLVNAEAVKDTIARGVSSGLLAYVGKNGDHRYEPFIYNQAFSAFDVEISDDVFVISRDTAEKYLSQVSEKQQLNRISLSPESSELAPGQRLKFDLKAFDQRGQPVTPKYIVWAAEGANIDQQGNLTASNDEGNVVVKVIADHLSAEAVVSVKRGAKPIRSGPDSSMPQASSKLSWSGLIPAQKWMNFYTKVLSRYATGFDLKLNIQFEVTGDISKQKADETRAALNDLGLDDKLETK
jgi:hypothetical protein